MQAAAQTSSSPHFNLIVAQRAQAIIDIAVIGSTEHFQSAILAVDSQARAITIDELFPAGFVAQPGQRVIVTLRLEGGHRESFSTEVISHDAGRYRLRLPDSIDYQQRRAAFRVQVPSHWARGGGFFTPGSSRCSANVRDISPSGIRLEVVDGTALRPGDTIEELYFELLGRAYQCRASVSNIRHKGSNSTEIGVAFIDLPRPQQRALERSLMQLQRRQVASSLRQHAEV